MPELPEVERARRLAERVAAGRCIVRVRCAKDDIVYEDVSPRRLERAMKGKRVVEVCRWGKQLWFELDAPPHPLFHFGMTGGFVTPDQAALKLASSPKKNVEESWPPRFTKIHFTFDDGGELVMTNKRRLGRIRLRDDPRNKPPISGLGFDPLINLPSPTSFSKMLRTRSAIIKPLLMDQSFAAGVGNWIADEILYQARIDPRKRASEISDAEARRIRAKMKSIIEKAVSVDAEKARFPKSWLFHHRWGKNSEAVTSRGEKIEHMTIGGRTTAWVPEVQR